MNHFRKIITFKNIYLIVFILLITICFETFQQVFFIKRFELYQDVNFFELLKDQFYRWLIWFILGFSLIYFIKKDQKKEPNFIFFFKYFGLILLLVLVNILLISYIQILISTDKFSLSAYFLEYFLFYVFQKSPIYILGYIAIVIILFLNFSNNLLEVEVKELIDFKEINNSTYLKLKDLTKDKTKVLSIKVGNKRKVIPVNTITWLEADDYCVKVHTTNNPTYSMRVTLKSLQEKLGDNFLRVHRKGIVNMSMIKELNLSTTPRLILKDNQEVPVSKNNLKLVKSFLKY